MSAKQTPAFVQMARRSPAPGNTGRDYVLANVRIPDCLLDAPVALPMALQDLRAADVHVVAGRVARVCTPGAERPTGLPVFDQRDGLVLPRFVDCHTHLDKGHIWQRRPNPDGTFLGARTSVAADREANWTAADVAKRMDFALRSAFVHGTAAVRTHIDSIFGQTAISWPVFAEMRAAWKGRVDLQAAALFPVEWAVDDEAQFRSIVDTVVKHGGIIGGLTFMGDAPSEKLDSALDRVMQAASAFGLDLDFHVDESDSPDARSLERIALAALRAKFRGRIVAGHCCSLALQSDADRTRVIERLGEARVAVVSLPMCNMYLQDRTKGRTPRWRGVAPLHELDAAGIPVLVASDNTRDPFYAYGDLDMLEVYTQATRILQLDHTERSWPRLMSAAPAEVMGLDGGGVIRPGMSADLVLTSARTWNELNARPQTDRVVLVGGRAIDRTLPDYRELD
jgi:cytosine/creatinine deaminase